MNVEQIEKMIDEVGLSAADSFRVREWFEQNQAEHTVSKLTNDQIKHLEDIAMTVFFHSTGYDVYDKDGNARVSLVGPFTDYLQTQDEV